jgi:hypothetical protein
MQDLQEMIEEILDLVLKDKTYDLKSYLLYSYLIIFSLYSCNFHQQLIFLCPLFIILWCLLLLLLLKNTKILLLLFLLYYYYSRTQKKTVLEIC